MRLTAAGATGPSTFHEDGLTTSCRATGDHLSDPGAVADFARAVADPADPHRLNPAYDSGDDLHPDDAGYQAMAAAINFGDL